MLKIMFDPGVPHQTSTVSLGGVAYRIKAVWRERLRGWYISLYLSDGTPIATGRRLAAGALVVRDIMRHDPDAPAGGVLLGVGVDDYAREDLSVDGGIHLYYLTRAEYLDMLPDVSEDVILEIL